MWKFNGIFIYKTRLQGSHFGAVHAKLWPYFITSEARFCCRKWLQTSPNSWWGSRCACRCLFGECCFLGCSTGEEEACPTIKKPVPGSNALTVRLHLTGAMRTDSGCTKASLVVIYLFWAYTSLININKLALRGFYNISMAGCLSSLWLVQLQPGLCKCFLKGQIGKSNQDEAEEDQGLT